MFRRSRDVNRPLFISHDLVVIAGLCDRVAVMRLGAWSRTRDPSPLLEVEDLVVDFGPVRPVDGVCSRRRAR